MSTVISTTQGSVSINDAAPVSNDIVAQGAAAAAAAEKAKDATTRADTFIAGAKAAFPLAPNLLADTKKFATLCGGVTNTSTEMFAAHNGSAWHANLYNGTKATGKIEVVTLDRLAAKGIPFGGDLARATNGPDAATPWNGSDFRAVLLDVKIDTNQTGGDPGHIYVLRQGSTRFTGLGKGEFQTQAACFVNVIAQSGKIQFRPSGGMSAVIMAGPDLRGKGWTYLQSNRTGWGGDHLPRFEGKGTMKVALALPYVGTGDHGGAFIYAQSLGRYTHGDDRLSAGMTY